jgi:hypothetical protein
MSVLDYLTDLTYSAYRFLWYAIAGVVGVTFALALLGDPNEYALIICLSRVLITFSVTQFPAMHTAFLSTTF